MQRINEFLQTIWNRTNRFQRILIGLMALRWIIATIFLLDLLPLDLRSPDYRFYLHHGGDQAHFLNIAESIVNGFPRSSRVGLGQALVMVPFVALIQPDTFFEIVAPLVIINGYILAGLSVVIIGLIAQRATGSERVALWSAGAWAILPFVTYFAFFWHFNPSNVKSSNVPLLGWLNGLSDAPALFIFLCIVWMLFRLIKNERPITLRYAIGVGALLGLLVMFRVHYAPAVVFIGLYIWIAHGIQGALAAGGGAMLAYIPQAMYNQIVFGLPITTGYISDQDLGHWGGTLQRPLPEILRSLPFNRDNLQILFDYYLGRRPWLIVPLLMILVTVIVTLIVVWRRRGWQSVILLIGVPLAYLVPMSITWPFRDAVIRFSMPAFPALIIVTVYLVSLMGSIRIRSSSLESPVVENIEATGDTSIP